MKIKNLLPWNWRKNDVPVRRECMFESIGMFPRIDVRERIDEASTHWHDRSVCSRERFRFRTASTSITSKPASNAACFA